MKIICSLVITVLLSTTFSLADDVLTFGRPDDPIGEISSQILVEAYNRISIKIDVIKLPAERSLLLSNKGSLDGEVNRIKGVDKKYENLIRIPVPVNFFEGVAFTKNRHFTVNGWDSLKPYSIAIRTGTKYAENGTRGMNVHKFITYDKIFMLVSKDRYDIGISSRTTGLYQISKHKLTGIKALEPPLERFQLYHYLHKKHKDLVPKISNTLQRMEQNGVILTIRERYIKDLLKTIEKID